MPDELTKAEKLARALHKVLSGGRSFTPSLAAQCRDELRRLDASNRASAEIARPEEEWHEDHGKVCWWKFPIDEPAWIGSPLCSDWPGYHTHWTPHPPMPAAPETGRCR